MSLKLKEVCAGLYGQGNNIHVRCIWNPLIRFRKFLWKAHLDRLVDKLPLTMAWYHRLSQNQRVVSAMDSIGLPVVQLPVTCITEIQHPRPSNMDATSVSVHLNVRYVLQSTVRNSEVRPPVAKASHAHASVVVLSCLLRSSNADNIDNTRYIVLFRGKAIHLSNISSGLLVFYECILCALCRSAHFIPVDLHLWCTWMNTTIRS